MPSQRKKPATTFVSYLRVSTVPKERNGFGLEAQRAAVERKLEEKRGILLGEYVELASGAKHDRGQLRAALEHAKTDDAVLVIARLDRLARD